ncbi:hypothetical protein VIOR103205_13635 [Vibrio ordalii]
MYHQVEKAIRELSFLGKNSIYQGLVLGMMKKLKLSIARNFKQIFQTKMTF